MKLNVKEERSTEEAFAKMSEIKIYISKQYDTFVLSEFNRDPSHYKRVMESIKENDYTKYQPILVDKNLNIVDGQNRFLACQELGLPIHFIVSNDIHIFAAADINQAAKNWGAMDYARHYAKRGKEDYEKLLDLCSRYDQSISVVGAFGKLTDGARSHSHNLKKGTFEFREDIDFEDFFEHMNIFKQYYDFAKKEKFIKAMLKLYMHPNYDQEKMANKLKYNSSIVNEQSRVGDMADELVKLYNFNSRKGKIFL